MTGMTDMIGMMCMILKNIFLSVISISAVVGLLILILITCRPLLYKRYTAKWLYVVWIVSAVRLVLPFHIPAGMAHIRESRAVSTILPEITIPEELTIPLFVPKEPGAVSDPAGSFADGNASSAGAGEAQGPVGAKAAQSSGNGEIPQLSRDSKSSRDMAEAELRQTSADKKTAGPSAVQKIQAGGVTVAVLDILALLWFLASIIFLLLHIAAYLYCKRQIMTKGRPVICKNGETGELILRLQKELGLKREIPIVEYEDAASPMVIGFVHPVLVLPGQVYEPKELYFILKHELIHYKRHDVYVKLLFAAANAVHWFNPVIYLMHKAAVADMELSCDELVVAGGSYAQRKAYTQTLLSALHKQCGQNTVLSTHFSFHFYGYFYGGTKIMKERFQHILSSGRKKNGRNAAAGMIAALTALGILAGYAVPKQLPRIQASAADVSSAEQEIRTASGKGNKESGKEQKGSKSSSQIKISCPVEKGTVLSADAKKVRKVMKSFAQAYFNGDRAVIRGLLSGSYEGKVKLYTGASDKVSGVVLKGFEKVNSIYSYVSLEFQAGAKNKNKKCLEAYLIKTEKEWKIYAYSLLSDDAQAVKRAASSFAAAYFQGDKDKISSYLADSYDGEITVYGQNGNGVSVLALKGIMQTAEIAEGGTCDISIEYMDTAVDGSFRYLSVSLVKQGNGFKILSYGEEM